MLKYCIRKTKQYFSYYISDSFCGKMEVKEFLLALSGGYVTYNLIDTIDSGVIVTH